VAAGNPRQPARLTGCQLKVLDFLTQGLRNTEIAAPQTLPRHHPPSRAGGPGQARRADPRGQAAAAARPLGISPI